MRGCLLVLHAACGRLGFEPEAPPIGDAPPDGLSTSHDEDGDGVADALDSCAHLVAPQDDGDGDGIGDACDPEPAIARQSLDRFITFEQPDPLVTLTGSGTWLKGIDDVGFDGNDDGQLVVALPIRSGRIALGGTITAVGPATVQRQLALGPRPAANAGPAYFVELNEAGGGHNAAISYFDGTLYTVQTAANLPAGMHPGEVTLQYTFDVGTQGIVLDGGWPGEPYHLVDTMDETPFAGEPSFFAAINNLAIRVRYVWIVQTAD